MLNGVPVVLLLLNHLSVEKFFWLHLQAIIIYKYNKF